MSTFIRVKRRFLEEPLENTIVLNINKRQKTEDSPATCEIFKFASTITNDQITNFNEHIQKLTKDEAIDIVDRKSKTTTEGNLNKRIKENQEKRTQNRLMIVNLSRAQICNSNDEETSELTILDVVKSKEVDQTASSNSEIVAQVGGTSSQEAFVYDIYIQNDKKDSSEDFDINDLSIMEYNDYLYSCSRLNNYDSDENFDHDDSDSNDENHWKNDYPDEENFSDGESIDERVMRKAIENLDVEDDLSSDEDLVCSAEIKNNADRYGTAYAMYKKKVLKEFKEDSDEDDDDDINQ